MRMLMYVFDGMSTLIKYELLFRESIQCQWGYYSPYRMLILYVVN